MFTHRVSEIVYPFVILKTAKTNLSLTSGHFLYVNNHLAKAGSVRPGDRLQLHDGTEDVVESVETELKKGLYNPQTIHGDIIVDGVRAATYTQSVDISAAHSLLAPLRFLFRLTGWSTSAFDSGAGCLARWIS